MTKKLWAVLMMLGLVMMLGACSSSDSIEDEESDEIALEDAPEDADTDEVPAEEASEDIEEAATDDDVAGEEVTEVDETEEVAPVAAAGSGQFEDYEVRPGDTLMKIAFESYGNLYRWRKIYNSNQDKIQDPNQLVVGSVLKVEAPSESPQIDRNGERYLIKEGETLGTISQEVYGTRDKWKRIWKNNPQLIQDPNKIYAGFYLYYTFTEQDAREKEMYQQQGQPLVQQDDFAPTSAQNAQVQEEVRKPASVGAESAPGTTVTQ